MNNITSACIKFMVRGMHSNKTTAVLATKAMCDDLKSVHLA